MKHPERTNNADETGMPLDTPTLEEVVKKGQMKVSCRTSGKEVKLLS